MTQRFDPKEFLDRISRKNIRTRLAGEVIFKQGAPADHVYYLQSGRAKETVASEHGRVAVVGMLEPGFFFGTSALDGGGISRLSTVTALIPSVVVEINKEAMNDALMSDPRFAQLFMAYLLDRNSQIEAEKIDLLFNSSEKRLAQKLLILAHFGSDDPPQIIGPEITQEMLANMIGTTRPRVNLFLVKFRRLGFIKYNGGIEVMPSLLKALLQETPETTEK